MPFVSNRKALLALIQRAADQAVAAQADDAAGPASLLAKLDADVLYRIAIAAINVLWVHTFAAGYVHHSSPVFEFDKALLEFASVCTAFRTVLGQAPRSCTGDDATARPHELTFLAGYDDAHRPPRQTRRRGSAAPGGARAR